VKDDRDYPEHLRDALTFRRTRAPVQAAFLDDRMRQDATLRKLEDRFVMSAAGQHQRADEYKDHLKHASILSLLQGAKPSITPPVLIVANDTRGTFTIAVASRL
jgi:hypothetical protein